MNVKIITDSACDLPKEIITAYNIEVLPFTIHLNEKEYLDGVTIRTEELYKAMRKGIIPKTSQVNPAIMKECFIKHAEKNESCIYIAFSGELSGTYQTSVMFCREVLALYPDFDLEIIDSRCGSLAAGITVLMAAQMAKQGKTKKEITEAIHYRTGFMEHIFTLDNIENLYRSGRISKTNAFIGNILNIKPVLQVVNGKIQLLDKVRGKNRAVKKIFQTMEERCANIKTQVIGIAHADDLESALNLKNMIEKRFGFENYIINHIGSVLGAHLGIGGVGLFFLNKNVDRAYPFTV